MALAVQPANLDQLAVLVNEHKRLVEEKKATHVRMDTRIFLVMTGRAWFLYGMSKVTECLNVCMVPQAVGALIASGHMSSVPQRYTKDLSARSWTQALIHVTACITASAACTPCMSSTLSSP